MTRKIREFNKKLKNNANAASKNLAHASFSERRSGPKDRRKLHTYLMNDRRSGIADRRREKEFERTQIAIGKEK